MPITQCIDNKYSYNKSISIITLHVAYTYPNIHASYTRLLTVRFSVVKCRQLLHPRGKLLGHSPGTVYLGSDASMTLDHDMHIHGPISYPNPDQQVRSVVLAVQTQLMCNSCPNCALIVMVLHKLQIQIYFFPQSLLPFKIQRTLENQISNIYIHLLNASPLNIGINLVVRSQAQRPHSVGIVPEMLEMACDGEWFRVFQIYSGRIILMEFPSNAFSRLNQARIRPCVDFG